MVPAGIEPATFRVSNGRSPTEPRDPNANQKTGSRTTTKTSTSGGSARIRRADGGPGKTHREICAAILGWTIVSASHVATISPVARGCSAVGSASPCQGEGRGFESGHLGPEPQRWSGRVVRQRPAKPCTGFLHLYTRAVSSAESASLTRKRSLVQSQYRAPQFTCGYGRQK